MSELSDGGTDVNEFRQFVKRHPALLYPAFEMQRHFQRKVLGEEFWSELGTKRIELSHGRYVAIAVFMQIHVDEAVYDRLIAQVSVPKTNKTNYYHFFLLHLSSWTGLKKKLPFYTIDTLFRVAIHRLLAKNRAPK